jgi:hypothetical protein
MKFETILENHAAEDGVYETKFNDNLELPVAYNMLIKSEAKKAGIDLTETDLVKIVIDKDCNHHVSFYTLE